MQWGYTISSQGPGSEKFSALGFTAGESSSPATALSIFCLFNNIVYQRKVSECKKKADLCEK